MRSDDLKGPCRSVVETSRILCDAQRSRLDSKVQNAGLASHSGGLIAHLTAVKPGKSKQRRASGGGKSPKRLCGFREWSEAWTSIITVTIIDHNNVPSVAQGHLY